jgi:hypothetical protein
MENSNMSAPSHAEHHGIGRFTEAIDVHSLIVHHGHMTLYIIRSDGLFLQPSPDLAVLGFMSFFQFLEGNVEGYPLAWHRYLVPFADVIGWELEWFSCHAHTGCQNVILPSPVPHTMRNRVRCSSSRNSIVE